jgi:hypothetical protein
MKSALFALALTACISGVAVAQTFTVDITSPDAGPIGPGGSIDFEISGDLTNDNLGLAFFAFDLEVDGPTAVNLSTAMVFDSEEGTVIDNFSQPEGYSIDFLGTVVGDELIQLGGGQNTIGNDPEQDPMVDFPAGTVVENIGHGGVVLFSGTITMPGDAVVGNYTLRLRSGSLFANYIDADNGDGTYDVDQVSNTVIGSSLNIEIADCTAPASVELVYADGPGPESPATFPCSGYIDPRREFNSGTELGIDSVTLVFNAEVVNAGGGSLTAAAFVVTEQCGGGDPPTVSIQDSVVDEITGRHSVTLSLGRVPTLQEWTTIQANVESACGGVAITNNGNLGSADEPDRIDFTALPGDLSGNERVDALDLLRMRQRLGGTCNPNICPSCNGDDLIYFDIDRNGNVTALDLLVWRQGWFGTGQATQAWQGAETMCDRP